MICISSRILSLLRLIEMLLISPDFCASFSSELIDRDTHGHGFLRQDITHRPPAAHDTTFLSRARTEHRRSLRRCRRGGAMPPATEALTIAMQPSLRCRIYDGSHSYYNATFTALRRQRVPGTAAATQLKFDAAASRQRRA
jgi:hypothetical protein